MLVDPDEPKKKPNKTNNTKTGNGKAEVGDKVTFSSGRYYEASDGKNEESNVNIASVFDNVTFNLPNVIDSEAFVRELVTNKKAERAIQAMTIDRIRGKSSLAKYKYKH